MNKHSRNATLLTGASSMMLLGGVYQTFHEYSSSSILYSSTGGSSGGSTGGSGGASNGGSGG